MGDPIFTRPGLVYPVFAGDFGKNGGAERGFLMVNVW
jgi:hypothetical protein